MGIGWNLAVSHKAIVAPGPQGWPFGLVGSASGAGEWSWWRVWWGVHGDWVVLSWPPASSEPLGPSRPLQEVGQLLNLSEQGVWGPPKPDGAFVCLGSQSGEPIMFPLGGWESGLSLCDKETET